MILGRPTNLWLGLVTATIAFVQVAILQLVPDANPVAVGTVLGALGGLLAVIIGLIANQPPSVAEGQPYTVVTPNEAPNVQKVANRNPTPPSIEIPKQ